MNWTQSYDPTGSVVLSTLLAAAPIVVLLGLLGLFRWSAPKAAAAGLVTALLVSIFGFGMPKDLALIAAGYGACFGLFPIGWIVLAAVFLYALTVETGQFEKIKSSVAALSPDRRIQAVLIAFCFGAFLEGCAGFGAPVAISAALMIGVGFPPLYAAGLALLANTAPVAFGSLGIPIITLGQVTGISHDLISVMAGRQLPLFSLLIPIWMVVTISGFRGLREVWPAVFVGGGSFALVQFGVSQYYGPMLVDVAGGLVSLAAVTLLLRFWQPRNIWRFPGESAIVPDPVGEATESAPPAAERIAKPLVQYTRREIASAWVPWMLLSLCVFLWGLPQFRMLLEGGMSAKDIATREAKAQQEGRTSAPLAFWEQPSPLAGRTVINFEIGRLHNHVVPQSAGGDTAREAGSGRVQIELADCHRHERAVCLDSFRDLDGRVAAPVHQDILPSAPHARLATIYDRLHAGDRLHHAVQRHRRHARAGVHAYRRALSVLRAAIGLARRGADGL